MPRVCLCCLGEIHHPSGEIHTECTVLEHLLCDICGLLYFLRSTPAVLNLEKDFLFFFYPVGFLLFFNKTAALWHVEEGGLKGAL